MDAWPTNNSGLVLGDVQEVRGSGGVGRRWEVARKCWLGSVVVDGMGVGVTWEGVPCTGWRRVGCGLYKGVEGMRVRGSADRQYVI